MEGGGGAMSGGAEAAGSEVEEEEYHEVDVSAAHRGLLTMAFRHMSRQLFRRLSIEAGAAGRHGRRNVDVP